MMTNKHPRLRHHTRKRKSGRVVTYYFYDMRGTGEPDIPLGTDYAEAIKKWDEIHNRRPRIVGTLEEAFEAWEKEALPKYTNKHTLAGFRKQLARIRPVFGPATWDSITVPHLKAYLKKRTAKVQANREISLLSIIWNWAIGEGYTTVKWPAAGMERSNWKNKESARIFEVTDDLFEAVYEVADQVLKDCMDIATATGLRLTDVRTITMPNNNTLRFQASKTSKPAYFDITGSAALSAVYARRKDYKADHVMFLSTPEGEPVTEYMLRYRYDKARDLAAKKAEMSGKAELAERIRAMFLRDMRKRAADLAEDDEAASKLLQHSDARITKRHYRMKGIKLSAVR